MDDFLSDLESNYISEMVCLLAQAILTIHTFLNLTRNKDQFPVKQLSPVLSATALFCFFLLNLISFITRIIQQNNGYYNPSFQGQNQNCGQCRLYNHPEMIVLAFLYNGLRQLPLLIFIVKTYRVCLCYMIDFNKQLSNNVVGLFSSQKKMLALCCTITVIFIVVGYFVFGDGTPYYGNLVFEFFCPKESNIYDWIVTAVRFIAMAHVYIISIYTYNELDFKRFLILIFILTNTEVILRLFLAFEVITKTTYHEFYYHSFIMNLFGTLIMVYYSTIKQQRNKPLSYPILQSFKVFLQNSLGFSVLTYYVEHLSRQNGTKKYIDIFKAYILIDQISMFSYVDDYRIKDEHIPSILQILKNIDIVQDLPERQKLIEKCNKKQIVLFDLRNVQQRLAYFCQRHIFMQWRQTESSKYLETQFRNNGVINLRMHTLGIEL